MTEKFYVALWNYISEKEKIKLCDNLARSKFQINGFRLNKGIPTQILAAKIVKCEKLFLTVLQRKYPVSYADSSAALEAINPETAVGCVAYLAQNQMLDEEKLMSLLAGGTAREIQDRQQDSSYKSKKKVEEFRKKYLLAHKEAEGLKMDLSRILEENNLLKKQILDKENELENSRKNFLEYRETADAKIASLNIKLTELENSIKEESKNNILILTACENDFEGMAILTYSKMLGLESLPEKYDEILYVVNETPFSVRRRIHKLHSIQSKIKSFSTKSELETYLITRRD